jgi:mRNA-degrading endonuclease RelE of RelBE toxin-antitoxin system
MTFILQATRFFANQLVALTVKEKRVVQSKLDLIQQNPYRFKSLHSPRFLKVFRVPLNIQKRDSRLIYVVLKPNIIIVCILERKNGYADLEKHLADVTLP